ncbi:DUF1800 domain-containing protein [Trinickia terrae]|uniref:DUF1800 domain-containing protein n=1 Tax=Trinickia terrae TaxID=2571161 RepID=A0A4U1IC68_9BURK|nr:DUF1800 domain-containing protein [Trinickia terrae]TKC91194.1 DUF1800 domain-containing protein [Trinickia terrae]
MANSPEMNPAAIALNRFGLGARIDDRPPADPKAWLLAQLGAYQPMPPAWAAQPGTLQLAQRFGEAQMQARQGADETAKLAARKQLRGEVLDTYRAAVNARVNSALTTPTPFVERLVHFWSNHFAVSTEKPQVAALAGAFEAEAIRPHVLGRFEDMLVAVERHPAMQLFLDQARSAGPDSPAARRAAARNPDNPRGLNENLAREIMELHTLGVRTGYTQNDVTEFARALTGWSVVPLRGGGAVAQRFGQEGEPGSFVFRPQLHEPGPRTIMGRTYDEPGEGQARAILHDLAASPATARHVAGKLARHFASDNPPAAMVERLAQAFQQSGGDLPTVYRALIDSPEAWSPVAAKFKTPWEWAISSLRGLGREDMGNPQAAPMQAAPMPAAPILTQLGQPVWRPGSPAGYDDIAASWAAPDALVRRVELAQRLAARAGGITGDGDRVDPRSLGQQLMAGSLSEPTGLAVSRAESVPTAVALLLVSPDFQRR